MPEYLSPGVYVEEIDAGPKPIAPVATSTAGAVGVTRRGPITPTAGHQLRRLPAPVRRPARPPRRGDPGGVGRPRPLVARGRVGQGVLRRGRRADVLPARPARRRGRVQPRLQRRAVRAPGRATSPRRRRRCALTPRRRASRPAPPWTSSARTARCSAPSPSAAVDYPTRTRHADRPRPGSRPAAARTSSTILAVDTALDVLTVDGGQRRHLGRRPERPDPARSSAPGSTSARRRPAARRSTHRDHRGRGRRCHARSRSRPSPARWTPRRRRRSAIKVGGAIIAVTAVAAAGAGARRLTRRRAAGAAGARRAAPCRSCAPPSTAPSWPSPAPSRLYPDALVQLEGAAGAEVLHRRHASATARSPSSAAPTERYVEGDGAQPARGRGHGALPPGRRRRGDRAVLRAAADRRRPPRLASCAGSTRGRGWCGSTPGADFDGTDLQAFPAVATGRLGGAGRRRRRARQRSASATSSARTSDPGQRTGHPGARGHRPGRDLPGARACGRSTSATR